MDFGKHTRVFVYSRFTKSGGTRFMGTDRSMRRMVMQTSGRRSFTSCPLANSVNPYAVITKLDHNVYGYNISKFDYQPDHRIHLGLMVP